MQPSDWLFVGIAAAVILVGAGIQLGATFLAEPEDPNMFLEDTLQDALERVEEEMPRPEDFLLVAFMPLQGDEDLRVTKSLARHLRSVEDGELYRGPDGDYVVEQLRLDWGREPKIRNVEDALRAADQIGVEAVLMGEGWAREDGDKCEVYIRVALVEAPRPPFREKTVHPTVEVRETLSKSFFSLEYYRLRLGETSAFWRVVLWFLICIALPFALYPVELRVFEKESNTASLALLGGLVGLNLLAALWLNGLAMSGMWAVLYVALLAVSTFYNLAVLNALHEAS